MSKRFKMNDTNTAEKEETYLIKRWPQESPKKRSSGKADQDSQSEVKGASYSRLELIERKEQKIVTPVR